MILSMYTSYTIVVECSDNKAPLSAAGKLAEGGSRIVIITLFASAPITCRVLMVGLSNLDTKSPHLSTTNSSHYAN